MKQNFRGIGRATTKKIIARNLVRVGNVLYAVDAMSQEHHVGLELDGLADVE